MKHITLKPLPRQKTRKHTRFKRLLASVVVAGTVVGGYVFLGSSLTVEISTLEIEATSILYELTITLEDDDVVLDSIVLRLESEFDEVNVPLDLGFQTGTLSNLQPNTTYTLKIIVTEGNGSTTLLTRTLITQALTQ